MTPEPIVRVRVGLDTPWFSFTARKHRAEWWANLIHLLGFTVWTETQH